MEKHPHYHEVITTILGQLAKDSVRENTEILPLFDTTHDNYLVLEIGWRDIDRIHHIIAHLRIHNSKIWVEADNTDREIVQQLLDAGISKAEIVLAFHSPQKRPLTEFAVS